LSDGTTIYLTRDLGGAYDKYQKYKFDKHIYVVQSAQTLHFNQLFKTLELMEEEFAKPGMLEHINFGMVKGMSTRRGTVKFLDDIIDEATDVMHEQMRSNEAKYAQVEEPERTSAVIGASAVKIQDMSAKRSVNHPFMLFVLMYQDQ
jgi:arginyl-tRNA synthetase